MLILRTDRELPIIFLRDRIIVFRDTVSNPMLHLLHSSLIVKILLVVMVLINSIVEILVTETKTVVILELIPIHHSLIRVHQEIRVLDVIVETKHMVSRLEQFRHSSIAGQVFQIITVLDRITEIQDINTEEESQNITDRIMELLLIRVEDHSNIPLGMVLRQLGLVHSIQVHMKTYQILYRLHQIFEGNQKVVSDLPHIVTNKPDFEKELSSSFSFCGNIFAVFIQISHIIKEKFERRCEFA